MKWYRQFGDRDGAGRGGAASRCTGNQGGVEDRGAIGSRRGLLTFCFEALVKETELESAILAIEDAGCDELDLTYLEMEE